MKKNKITWKIRVVSLFLSLLTLCGLYNLILCTFYVKEGIPQEPKGSMQMLAPEYEVYGNKVFFQNDVPKAFRGGRLLETDLTDFFKSGKKVGIKDVVTLHKGGPLLYILCEDFQMQALNMDTNKVKFDVNLLNAADMPDLNRIEKIEFQYADETGAYVVLESYRQDTILHVSSTGKVQVVHHFDEVVAEFFGIKVVGDKLIYSRIDEDESMTGIYALDLSSSKIEKLSDKRVRLDPQIPIFVWNNYYGYSDSNYVHLIALDGKEEKELNLTYSCSCMCIDDDYMYRGSTGILTRYNLRTGTYEVAKGKEGYNGIMKVENGKLYLGYAISVDRIFFPTRVYVDDLSKYVWEDVTW